MGEKNNKIIAFLYFEHFLNEKFLGFLFLNDLKKSLSVNACGSSSRHFAIYGPIA
jgi:hypothetical protein